MRLTAQCIVRSAAVVIFFLAKTASAGSLHLPRVFDPTEIGTVGVAFVNPTLTAASATFRWRTAAGESLYSAQRTIPAKGQLALTIGQVFPDAAVAGWLAVDVDVDQVSGFWLTGDFVTSTDGAPLLSTTDAVSYPAFASFTSATEISFANLGTATLTGTLNLVNASGRNAGSAPFSVPPLGVFQQAVATLFPAQASNFGEQGFWISVGSSTSSAQVIGTALTRNPNSDNIVANAAYQGSSRFLFPHVVDGPIGGVVYTSLLILTNFTSTAQNVTLTLRQSGASPVSVEQSIPVYGVLQSSVAALFGVSSLDGWLLVESTTGIGGLLTYTDAVAGGTTAIEMQPVSSGDTALIFGHIANLAPWWTGIALANSSTTNAQIEVYALDPSGKLLGGPAQSSAATFTLPAQSKRAFLLGDLVPQTQSRTSDGGYVYIRTTNGVKIHGTELFFLRSGRVYANVPANRMGVIAFNPPPATATGGGTVIVEQSFMGDANNQPLTTARACNAITLNMRIRNTTGLTVSVTRQYRAIGPNGYTLTMFSTIGDQAAGTTTRFTSVTIPCSAPDGTYTFNGSVDYNGVISSASGNFSSQGSTGSGGGAGGGGTGGGGTGGAGSLNILTNNLTPFAGVPIQLDDACRDTYTGRNVVQAVTLMAAGGAPLSGYTWTLSPGSTYPPGTTVESLTGIFKGNNTTLIPGTYTFMMQVSDGSATATATFLLVVKAESSAPINGIPVPACPAAVFQQPNLRQITLPNAQQGTGYGASLAAVVGPSTSPLLNWSLLSGQLPPGMSIDLTRGIVRGTPTSSAAGNIYRFQVNVRNLNATGNEQPVAICPPDGCPEYVISVQ